MREGAGALLALWNDVAPEREADYEPWHAVEHVPERLTVPGMQWGLRFGHPAPATLPRYFTLYGLRDTGVLESPPYQRLLREPTPASAAMRPAFRNVSRWVCELLATEAIATAGRLAVWTSLRDAQAIDSTLAGLRASGELRGHLCARRLAGAAPLPWVAAPQDGGIEGEWLLCAALAEGPSAGPAPAGAVVYQRLPVGG